MYIYISYLYYFHLFFGQEKGCEMLNIQQFNTTIALLKINIIYTKKSYVHIKLNTLNI